MRVRIAGREAVTGTEGGGEEMKERRVEWGIEEGRAAVGSFARRIRSEGVSGGGAVIAPRLRVRVLDWERRVGGRRRANLRGKVARVRFRSKQKKKTDRGEVRVAVCSVQIRNWLQSTYAV